MKIATTAAFVVFSAVAAHAGGISVSVPGGGGISIGWGSDGSNAVACTINSIVVLAEHSDDCTSLGGTVATN